MLLDCDTGPGSVLTIGTRVTGTGTWPKRDQTFIFAKIKTFPLYIIYKFLVLILKSVTWLWGPHGGLQAQPPDSETLSKVKMETKNWNLRPAAAAAPARMERRRRPVQWRLRLALLCANQSRPFCPESESLTLWRCLKWFRDTGHKGDV